jgi:IS30 family transposase
MPRGPRLTERECGMIDAYLKLSKSTRWIAKEIGKSATAVGNYIRRQTSPNEVILPAKKVGRRVKLTKRDCRRIFRLAIKENLGSRKIAHKLGGNVCYQTVLRVLKGSKFARFA